MSNLEYVQYGSGFSAPVSWRNFDASLTLRFEKLPIVGRLYTKNRDRFPVNVEYGDIAKGLPVLPGSCQGVYCSHVLEHLCLTDFRSALKNTNKILRAGGIFRFVLPDLKYEIKKYLADDSDIAAITFMKETSLGCINREKNIASFFINYFGKHKHLWMWDYKSIKHELEKEGFVKVRRAYFGDSADKAFADVENIKRWEGFLGVECKKYSGI